MSNENYISEPKSSFSSRKTQTPDIRSNYPKPDFSNFNGREMSFTSRDIPTPNPGYNPGGGNTTGEGSSLPPGEVSFDQIASIMNG